MLNSRLDMLTLSHLGERSGTNNLLFNYYIDEILEYGERDTENNKVQLR